MSQIAENRLKMLLEGLGGYSAILWRNYDGLIVHHGKFTTSEGRQIDTVMECLRCENLVEQG